ncbi:MAG: CPBP family intramembrane metalloprotease [Balneolales bacterium]|nr:CPBP family intramembrane metalloprotease [Balneolales bacterium]
MQNSFSDQERPPFFERHGFPEWLVALAWLVIGMVIFQTVAMIYLVVSTVLAGDFQVPSSLAELDLSATLMISSNSVGQIVGLGVGSCLIALLSVSRTRYAAFMRFQMPQMPLVIFAISAGLMISAQPLIWYAGYINQFVPLPESVLEMERVQTEMLANVITGGLALWFLVINVGVVPAICEEIMFRSYLHRLFERSAGVLLAVLITGLLFGLFHLRLTQLIPLAGIGILLGWVTVKSNSVFPAMLMHFMHNSGTVSVVHSFPELMDYSSEGVQTPPALWLVALSLGITIYLITLLNKISRQNTG